MNPKDLDPVKDLSIDRESAESAEYIKIIPLTKGIEAADD